MVKIFVGGFPLESTELDIVKLVGPYADVSTIKIVRDKISKKCKGYAFLEVGSEAEADRVIDELDGTEIGNRVLTINKVEEQAVKPKPFKPTYNKPSYNKPSFQGSAPAGKRPRRTT